MMFHFVFDSRGAENLNAAMDMDESLDGETVLVRDDYSVGPIQDLFSESGLTMRKKWWEEISEEGKDLSRQGIEQDGDSKALTNILQRMGEEEFDQIWIWMAPNPKDICGYYWLIAQLKAFAGRIFLVSLNNLPFINEKGAIFYPVSLAEIPAREFVKARRLARPVTLAEFETDPDEWIRLMSENKNLRISEGGKKITQQSDDYYDRSILHFLQPVFQKTSRVIQQYILKSSEKVNESFLNWRFRQLAAAGFLEQQGDMIRLFVNVEDQSLMA
jgi:hypothetical protein